MGGCATCAARAASATVPKSQLRKALLPEQTVSNEECNYTLPLLKEWETKLQKVLNQGSSDLLGISPFQVRQHLSYVKSAINYKRNLCFYAPFLAKIVQVIQQIDELT